MSILKKLKKARQEARAQAKAAKARAKAEVKAQSKDRRRQQKLLSKQEKHLLKTEEKGLKKRRKHEQKMAEKELEKLREGHFNAGKVKRYAGALRTAAPLLLPLVYRALVGLKSEKEKRKAHKAGVSSAEMASFSGYGAPLKARTAGIRNSLKDVDLPAGFKRDVRERLEEVDAAIDNAEFMTEQQRRRAHKTISGEIDSVTAEIQQRLGE